MLGQQFREKNKNKRMRQLKKKKKPQFRTEKKSGTLSSITLRTLRKSCFSVLADWCSALGHKDLHANFYSFSSCPSATPRWRRKGKKAFLKRLKVRISKVKLHRDICIQSFCIVSHHDILYHICIFLNHIESHHIVLYHIVLKHIIV